MTIKELCLTLFCPDTAVTGVNVVPQTISTVSDFTVDSINSVPETINTVTDLGVNNIRNDIHQTTYDNISVSLI